MEAGNGRPSIVEDLTAFPYDCFVPHADVANFGPYLSMEVDQSIYMLFVLLLSSELWCR